jgi:hypothetical protein
MGRQLPIFTSGNIVRMYTGRLLPRKHLSFYYLHGSLIAHIKYFMDHIYTIFGVFFLNIADFVDVHLDRIITHQV